MSNDGYAARNAVSAGGVIFRRRDGIVEVVLVARSASNLWALPKGTPEPGETLEETALREVSEETGLGAEIVGEVGQVAYAFTLRRERVRVSKVVHHYLMEPRSGDLSLHDHEYDLAGWYEIGEAIRRMTYDNERDIVELAAALIAQRAPR